MNFIGRILFILSFSTVLFFFVPSGFSQQHDLNRADKLNTEVIKLSLEGRFSDAIPLAKEALNIRESMLGSQHQGVAVSLNNLAELYREIGDYGNAERLYKRSLVIIENALGKGHPNVATIMNNLAVLYSDLGNYSSSELLYKNALAIQEKNLGKDHQDVALTLNNLAELYHTLGDYSHAELLHKRALTIYEKVLGKKHPYVANSLNNLAELYFALGDYSRAETLHKKALVIWESALGPDDLTVANSYNNLAELYRTIGEYSRAKPLYKRALTIREKILGPEHPLVALSLNNLAALYVSMGDHNHAESLFKKALTIKEKAFGRDHPEVTFCLYNLAVINIVAGNQHQAYRLYMRAIKIEEKMIDQVVGFTSEKRALKYIGKKRERLEDLIWLAATRLKDDPLVRKQVMDVWLRRKGIVLEAQRRFQEALLYNDNKEAVRTFQELAGVRANLTKLAFGGPGNGDYKNYRTRIEKLEAQQQVLENNLIKLSSSYALAKKKSRADTNQIAAMLPQGSVLIDFARIEALDSKEKGEETKWKTPHYFVFVLHAGQGDKVGLINLGPSDPIDLAVEALKKSMRSSRAVDQAHEASRKMHDLVFLPIQKELGQARVVFISPDGNLNLIPFEILQDSDDRYLIEYYTFNYLASGRDALGFGQSKGKTGKSLIIGDPDFNRNPAVVTKKTNSNRRSVDMRGLHFSRLPGTREEIKAIHKILGSRESELYIAEEARESLLVKARSPRIIHLATHGFFLTDMQLNALRDDARFAGHLKSGENKEEITIENPLLRSGLAMAGANVTLKSDDPEQSTGLLTAEKVLSLRLKGTEMIVLSACATGLGEVKSGEGVYGLRRAFILAGARSLVMSMWDVPDKETQELMIQFYKNIYVEQLDRAEALRQAALKQIQTTRQRYGHTHPLFWGAFIYLGEPDFARRNGKMTIPHLVKKVEKETGNSQGNSIRTVPQKLPDNVVSKPVQSPCFLNSLFISE